MSKKSENRDFIIFLIKLVIGISLLKSLIVSPFNIPSESMQPRLLIGDYLLVSKWPYGYSRYSFPFRLPIISDRVFSSVPERGDVVVFAAPYDDRQDWIKRVVGLPGDTVQMQDGVLFLNSEEVTKAQIDDLVIPVSANMIDTAKAEGGSEPCFLQKFEFTDEAGARFCRYPRFRETLPGGRSYEVLDLVETQVDNSSAYKVPEGHVFVMGDNRDRSSDSRVAVENGGVGMLPMRNLIGRAQFSYFSTDGSASWLLPWTWFTAARFDRMGDGF